MNIYDIAREANVSIATVSRVMNGKGNVSANTEKRVRAVLSKYQYAPNNVARALATNSMDLVGVVVEDIRNRQYTSTAYHIERSLHAFGYSTMFCNVPTVDIRSYAQTFARTKICGLIVIGSVFMNEHTTAAISQYLPEIPVIVANGSLPCTNAYSLLSDDESGIRQAVRHLLDRGHTKIAYVNDNDTDSARRKLSGYRAAMQQAGLAANEILVRTESSYEGGRLAAHRLMAEYRVGPDFTAIVFPEDLTAIGCMHSFQEHGLSVPRDVAVTGFGNSAFRPLTHPLLTTVDTHLDILGSESVQYLIRRLSGEDCPRQVILPPDLLLGESS